MVESRLGRFGDVWRGPDDFVVSRVNQMETTQSVEVEEGREKR